MAEASKKTHLTAMQRFALYFYDRPVRTALVALAVAAFGLVCFLTLMRREGFPSIDVPYAIGQAVYPVNDAEKVDADIARPLGLQLAKEAEVKSVTSTAQDNVAIVVLQYAGSADAEARTSQIVEAVKKGGILPEGVSFHADAAKMGFTERGDDAVLSLYNVKNPTLPTAVLAEAGANAVKFIEEKNLSQVKNLSLIAPTESVANPMTGEKVTAQTRFERYAVREDGETRNYHAVALGAIKKADADTLEFDAALQRIVDDYNAAHQSDGYKLAVTGSFAPTINQQMAELGRTLLEGLLAVLVIGSLVIAVRASLITVLSMVTVILSSFALLYAIGYTLNTIVLFSLILGLALIVDDTIIMVEAIDKERRRLKDRREIVGVAARKIARAMIAATTTAALSFTPLFFVGGVIGDFVRAVPVTIISALVISLFVALIVIPLFARGILLRPKQIGPSSKRERAADIEAAIARFVSRPILWARGIRRREVLVGLLALLVTVLFIGGSGLLFNKVKFNIFPPTKDSNELAVSFAFPQGTTIAQAEQLTDKAVRRMGDTLGAEMTHAANYGSASATNAWFEVYLTDYSKRSVTSHDLVAKLRDAFAKQPDGVSATVRTVDIGPPASNFQVRVDAEADRAAAVKLSKDVANYLASADIRRADGSRIEFEKISQTGVDNPVRDMGKAYVGVEASYKADDTTMQINRTKAAVEQEFTPERVAAYGLDRGALSFDFGMEEDNQDSFKTLLLAFPVVVLVIFLVLAVEFRSILQPLIIFMAVPFSLPGIMLGLYLTNNAFSFFAMLGFFALIGLSIKNTILLTDYANQARRAGKSPVDAIHDALAERFRPLLATSLTAVVSLIPLAVASPFWQGLCVVLICGLLSSTLLVVTVFPYFYLGAEFLRTRVRK